MDEDDEFMNKITNLHITKLLKEGKIEDAEKEARGKFDTQLLIELGAFVGESANGYQKEREFEPALMGHNLALNYFKLVEKLAENNYVIDYSRSMQGTARNNLGNLYHNLRKFTEAEESYKEALEIYRKLAEKDPGAYLPDVATTQNNLGALYSDLRKFTEAEELYKEALEIRRKLAEKDPGAYLPDVATTQNNLGNLYSNLRKFTEAEESYKEALEIYRKLAERDPGAYLPDVAMTQNNLGALYSDLRKFTEAEESYKEALEIYRKLAEKDPGAYLPDVATTQNNLGALYSDLRKFTEAEESYKEALEIRRKLAEKDPGAYLPDVATTQNNLGNLYSNLRKFAEAEESYKSAFEFSDNIYDKELIARNFCLLYFSFVEKEKIEEHKQELEKIKEFFRKNNNKKVFLVDACERYMDVMEYFSAKDHYAAKNKLDEVKSYLDKCDEKELSEFSDRIKDLILLDEKFNHLICLLPVYNKHNILNQISNLGKEAEVLSEKEFLIGDFIKNYISCIKTFDKCFDLFRYEKPIFINTKELSESEEVFISFGFKVYENPVNSVVKIANKINECSDKINKNPEKKKDIINEYWNVKIKELLPNVIPQLNGISIKNMVNNEASKQIKKLLERIAEPIERTEVNMEKINKKIDALLKKAESNEETLNYIRESVEKAISENKEILDDLKEITEQYQKSHAEVNEKLNSINLILTNLINNKDFESIPKIADGIVKNENKLIDNVKGEDKDKNKLKGIINKLKKGSKKMAEMTRDEILKKTIIEPLAKPIVEIIKEAASKSPEVIELLAQIIMQSSKFIPIV